MLHVDIVDLDSCFFKEAKDRPKARNSSGDTIKDPLRAILDGDFELTAFDVDPSRGVNIIFNLPDPARKKLKACLRENADLFAWSVAEMPDLDREVAYHYLTINTSGKVVAQ